MSIDETILQEWQITPEELTLILEENPSLKGMLFGYVAELKLKERITAFEDVSYFTKFDDHNRSRKGDLYIVYKDRAFDIESKSLQTATINFNDELDRWEGKSQVDASDRRPVILPDGTSVDTTLLLKGEFDILAVNCYAFNDEWQFIFTRNANLPTTKWHGYTAYQQEHLLSSMVAVTWPPEPPFTDDIKALLNEMVANGEGADPEIAKKGGDVITRTEEEEGSSGLPPLGDLVDED